MHFRHRRHQQETMDYPKTPITVDHTCLMAEVVGQANGLSEADLAAFNVCLEDLDRQIKDRRADGQLGFLDLPYDQDMGKEIKKLARQFKEWCRDLLVLAVGDSASGIRALQQALCHPAHNFFPIGRRQLNSRLFVADHSDPDSLYGLLDDLELKRLLVNVVSQSGDTPEVMADFLFVLNLLQGRLGEDKARECFLLTTGPEGGLRRLAASAGFVGLSFPAHAAGGCSIFSAAALFPAAMAGIDLEGLLAGARFMDQRLQAAPLSANPAYRLAACYYLALKRQGGSLFVMPSAAGLAGTAEWFCLLWAESLGAAGPFTLQAVRAGEQHALGQLLAGPATNLVTFLEVDKFQHNLPIPAAYPDNDSLNYLGGRTLAEVVRARQQSLACNLVKHGRPHLTIKLPEINAFNLGQLVFLWQVTVAALKLLFQLQPFAQSAVEGLDKTTLGLLGHPAYGTQSDECAQALPRPGKYVV